MRADLRRGTRHRDIGGQLELIFSIMNRAFCVLRIFLSVAFAFLSVHPFLLGQEPVIIQVHADRTLAPLKPVWAYFGYD